MNEYNLTTDELVDNADRLEAEGNVDAALACWRIVVEREPDPISLCRFGRLATKAREWAEAEQAFQSAIALSPELSFPYDCLGSLYLKRDNAGLAQTYFKKSLEIEENAFTYTLLGAAQLRLGVPEARESFVKALELDPSYEEAYYDLGLTLRHEHPARAVILFQKAIELDPDYGAAHRELGWALRQLEQLPEAEHHLRRAIDLDDSDGWTYIYLGNLLWVKGDLVNAEKAFQTAIRIWPDESVPYWCQAIFYEYQGRSQEADFFYELALQVDPDDSQANLRFGLFLKEIGEPEKAKEYLHRALKSDPNNGYVRSILDELE
ncbi:MAG TPA: tetratricopeptide repeat protein [Blastocatellia bacterium]|jgi:tetratricopeptide (TPR) repeat protein|nr:tetratricopeptide repeat protein [Blastocatellia bacterium]